MASKRNTERPRGPQVTTALRRVYRLMLERHGHQGWWPGDTPFEICVGAILTQNTSWTNVERAIANLKAARVLEPRKLFALPESQLAELLRPTGYFNLKARRLRSFLRVLVEQFNADLRRLFAGSTAEVRARLLDISGIGPETADSMLLYAGNQPSFVIDAYTKRIFSRHGWWTAEGGQGAGVKSQGSGIRGQESEARQPAKTTSREEYDSLKTLCEASLNHLPADQRLDYWQDYHAQLVMVGKDYCRPRNPRCDACPLKPLLPATPRESTQQH